MYWTSLRVCVRGLKVHEKWQCVQVPCLSLETSLGLLLHYLHKLRTATFFSIAWDTRGTPTHIDTHTTQKRRPANTLPASLTPREPRN